MSELHQLRKATSLHDLAAILNYTPSALSYLVYKRPAKYTQFSIPKSNGSTRQICAPCDELKALQRRVKILLDECLATIENSSLARGAISHGFKQGHSIITNAETHKKRRYVFNVDLKGFFDSIHMGRVRGYLISNNDFKLNPNVATVMAQIMCHDNKLPQGSPTSPVVSNLIGHLLDLRLVQLAKRNGCSYSRYADDLTFSTNKKTFPKEIALSDENDNSWAAGPALTKVIQKSGFELNHDKTRMQYRTNRQSVTGLVVNQITNTPAEVRRTARAMAFHLFNKGHYLIKGEATGAEKAKALEVKDYTQLASLDGLFSFIYMVNNFNRKKIVENSSIKIESFKKTSLEMIHGDFLFYKNFYASPLPTIMCEGKTDNIYLTCAMKSLIDKFPQLCKLNKDGKPALKVRFINYSELTHRVLDLNGGSADLAAFIRTYAKNCGKYKAHPPLNPTIIVVDNDSGSDPIFKAIKDVTGNRYSIPNGKGAILDKTKTTYYIAQNLSVVLTPLRKDGQPTMMEDFFPANVLKAVWDNKTFEILSKSPSKNTYNKNTFAQRIVKADRPNIEFKRFAPILRSISEVIEGYHVEKSVIEQNLPPKPAKP
ncbi:RNA-directed DNA polymerase [Pseudomonas protegens]|uniref:RNA-directed DNA polymerase n=1 Tax=Pseudomonas protegens TaxID=380021 RepID=A0A7G8YH87_9PSED|nr:retron Ec67 family RNA-directed DNA polymerase/endonuclease [Pseudomonas protegens]QNH75036.1 RNA-directed DNA polymerase [Pseudomonas protegens]QNL04231.1 RNA-directed DNA polymerase [Pseudomonas protegens]